MEKNKYIKIWLISGIILVTVMFIIGGITRLTNSGLSIVEWDLVSGTLPPLTDEQWNITFEKYKQFPEYKKLNYGMDIGQFKQIFWWEYIHRLIGRVIGLVFLIPFLIFYFKKWLSRPLLNRLLWIFFFGAMQGVMGWFMVMSGLQDQPHVSHFRLAAHFSLALLLIGLIVWTLLKYDDQERPIEEKWFGSSITIPFTCLILLFIQIVLGAFVAGLNAGFTFTNFPMMGQNFFPSETILSLTHPLYNGVVFQFIHRWLAFFVLAAYFILYLKSRPYPLIRKTSKVTLYIVFSQVIIGILTLLLRVPVSLGVLHQVLAVIIFILTVKIIYQYRYQTFWQEGMELIQNN